MAQRGLGGRITGASRLAQKFLADALVAGVAAVTAHQLAKPALRDHYPFARGLLEHAPGEVFDVGLVAQAGAVEQPEGDLESETLGCSGS